MESERNRSVPTEQYVETDEESEREVSPESAREKRRQRLTQLTDHGVIMLCMAVVSLTTGIATIVVTRRNIALPYFNVLPVIIGFVGMGGAAVVWRAVQAGTAANDQETPSLVTLKRHILRFRNINCVLVLLALVSAILSMVSAGICINRRGFTRLNDQGQEIDISESCQPDRTGNTVVGLVSGIVCVVILFWSAIGLKFYLTFDEFFVTFRYSEPRFCWRRKSRFAWRRKSMNLDPELVTELPSIAARLQESGQTGLIPAAQQYGKPNAQ